MSIKTASGMNYIDLLRLKAANLLQNDNINIILNDDIWDKDTLIIKSGGSLTESLLDKLINFGIKKVSVNFSSKKETTHDFMAMDDFLKNRCVLIVENNLSHTSWLYKNLLSLGLEKGNLYVTDDYNSINNYFRNIKIDLFFICAKFYEKSQRCVDKYSHLRNTHTFVIMEENESVRKLKKSYSSDVKFISKPLGAKKLSFYVSQALNQNFLDLYMEEAQIS